MTTIANINEQINTVNGCLEFIFQIPFHGVSKLDGLLHDGDSKDYDQLAASIEEVKLLGSVNLLKYRYGEELNQLLESAMVLESMIAVKSG